MDTVAPVEAPTRRTATVVNVRALLLRPELTAIGGLLLTLIIFSLLSPLFLARQTAITVASTASELGLVAVCVTLLMISGNFDLSIGAIVGFSGYGALYALRAGYPPAVAILPSSDAANLAVTKGSPVVMCLT